MYRINIEIFIKYQIDTFVIGQFLIQYNINLFLLFNIDIKI